MKVEPVDGKAVLRRVSGDLVEEATLPLKSLDIEPTQYSKLSRFCKSLSQPWRPLKRERLHIRVEDGIGDLHWVFLKLQTVRDLCGAREVILHKQRIPKKRDYYGRSERADDFVTMNPTVTELVEARDIIGVPPCGYMIDTLDYDYILNPNVVMERNGAFSDWMPTVPANYTYKMNWPPPDEHARPVVYFGDRHAEVTWGGDWHDAHWAALTKAIADKYGEPIAVGLGNDKEKATGVKNAGGVFEDLVGETTLKEVFSLLLGAKIVVGSISGLTIVSAANLVPTVAFWPDTKSLQELPRKMRGTWMPPGATGDSYFPFGYSSSVDQVAAFIRGDLEWSSVQEQN